MVFKRGPLSMALFLSVAACGESAPSNPETAAPEVTPDLEPPPPGEGFQIDLGRLTVDAGVEALHCLRVPIPEQYAGAHAYATGFASRFSRSTHHFFVAYNAIASGDEAGPCYGDDPLLTDADGFEMAQEQSETHADLDGAKFLSGAGEGAYETFLPEGYGMLLENGDGLLVTNWHILNTTPQPANVFGIMNVYATPQAAVTHPVRVLNCLLRDVTVEPESERSVSATCTVPFDLDLVVLGSHAHKYLQRFEARLFDGSNTHDEPFYVSTDWDSPKLDVLEQPMSLTAGQGITFTCHYRNPTDQLVSYGGGELGEMCATMNGYAFPKSRPNELPPPLGGIVFNDGFTTKLVDTTDIDGPF